MTGVRTIGQMVFASVLCLSLVIWSVVPSVNHTPAVVETFQDHLELIAEHGHSHGVEHDLYWVLHGHSHDTADHDHSQALLMARAPSGAQESSRDGWRFRSSDSGEHTVFRIDRPPRA